VRIRSSLLRIEPKNQVRWHRDVNDNSVAVVTFEKPSDKLVIASEVIIENRDDAPLDFIIDKRAVNFPFEHEAEEENDLIPFQGLSYPSSSEALEKWIAQFWQEGETIETYVLLDKINKTIKDQIGYTVREEPGVQSPLTTLTKKTGSCRDMATLFIETCRALGMAARFISGYQYVKGLPVEAGSTHAWAEVYLPGAGWKGFDATAGNVVDSNYIPIAVSTNPESVPPIAGAFSGYIDKPATMSVTVDIVEITESF
jgi:transglutaminase-like putative cysteine protease